MLTDRIYRHLRHWPYLQRQWKRVVLRLPRRERLVRHFGSKLACDATELHGFYLYYERDYDIELFRFLESRIGRYSHAIDIGANIGIYACFLAKHVPAVDAFEPEVSVLSLLRANLARIGANHVRVHACCVGNQDGAVNFASPSPSNGGLGSIATNRAATPSIPCTTLDRFLNDIERVPLFIRWISKAPSGWHGKEACKC